MPIRTTDRLRLTGEILREQETLFYRMCRLIRSCVNLFSSFFFYRVVRARLYNVTRLFFREGEKEKEREREALEEEIESEGMA